MATKAKMKKGLLILGGGAAAILLVIVIFVLTLDINAYKPRIEAIASEAAGMNVRINGPMKLLLFPHTGISLENVAMQHKDADVALATKVEVGIKLLSLIKREWIIERVSLDSPTFFITKDKNGRFNFETHRKLAGSFAAGDIFVKGGDLVYRDERSRGRMELSKCDLAIRDLSVGTGEFVSTFSLDGDLSCGEARMNQLKVSNIAAVIKGHGGKFEANPFTVKIFGGNGEGKITLAMTDGRPEYVVDFTITRFRFEEMLETFKERKSIRGFLDMKTHLAMAGRSTEELTRTAQGDISLRGQNLSLVGISIDRALEKYEESTNVGLIDIGASLIAGPVGMLLTKGYEFEGLYEETQGGESVIRILNSDWKVRNGIAEAQDVALATEKNRIALKGKLDLVRERYDSVIVAALDEKGCVRLTQEMHGSFRHPQIEKVSILRTIAGPILNLRDEINKLFAGGKCKVFYSGSVKQPKRE